MSSDGTWKAHADDLIKKNYCRLAILKKLKLKFDRKSNEKI